MDNRELVLGVRLLHRRRLDDVPTLLHDVQLDEPVVPLRVVGDGVELLLVQPVDVTDVPQPGVQQPEILGRHGGLDAAAAIVPADDDMLDAQVADGVVDDAHDVEVRIDDEVGNVAVHKRLAWLEARDLLGGDTRVAAPDPEVLGSLTLGEAGEVARVIGGFLLSPFLVVLEDLVVGLLQILDDILGSHIVPLVGA